ncbi:MAG: hypothetical protein KDC46_01490 [Thermoleophilia bacterium]|nr:hypothetical protein [Thermoleophilia bacterium]
MSKQMKVLVGVLGVVVLAAVVLTMFGKPPNLPLGPLQGMLAGEDDTVVAADSGAPITEPMCDPVTGEPVDVSGAGAATDPNAGAMTDPNATGAATDPATGAAIDPNTGQATDPNAAGGSIDPNTGQAIDPATGAPVAAGDGWSGGARVVAAGAGGYDAGRVPDTWVNAADAGVDPNTGLPADTTGTTDPAAATDPTTGAAIDPTTGAAVDPTTGAATDTAGANAPVPCSSLPNAGGTDPNAMGGTTDPTGTGADAGAGAGSGAGAGAGGNGASGAGATSTVNRSTTDGTNSGNNPEALRAAKDATAVMQKANITVTTTATLVPATGGIGRPAAVKKYRSTVTSASIVMTLDDAAMQQWTGAGKKVQTDLVKSFMTRLGKSYRKAVRSITILDSQGTVLAIGDASANGGAARVKLY